MYFIFLSLVFNNFLESNRHGHWNGTPLFVIVVLLPINYYQRQCTVISRYFPGGVKEHQIVLTKRVRVSFLIVEVVRKWRHTSTHS
jgi:hypothetical protein